MPPKARLPPLTKDTAQQIANMQKNIVDNLQILLNRQTKIMDDTDIDTKEFFANVNEGSIMLNPEDYPEVSDYADVYNQNIALLDDPSNMINASFNTYINIQDKKIGKLRTQLNQLQTDIQNNKVSFSGIKGFKSMNNSQILNVEDYYDPNYSPMMTNPNATNYSTTTNPNITNSMTSNPTTTKPFNNKLNGASQYPNYLIYGNNGCLQYDQLSSTTDINGKTTLTPATWAFKPCNANEPRQQFVSTQVNDLPTYNSFITSKDNLRSHLNSTKTTTFGFNVVNPINTQDQCLQLNNDGLSVMPCNLDFEQRFRPIYNTVLP